MCHENLIVTKFRYPQQKRAELATKNPLTVGRLYEVYDWWPARRNYILVECVRLRLLSQQIR